MVIHLTAIARRAGIPIGLDDLERIGAVTPLLVDCKPSGAGYLEDLDRVGGIAPVLRELDRAGLIERDARTVSGVTLGEMLDATASAALGPAATVPAAQIARIVRPVDDPLGPPGSIRVVRGTLAPEGAVIKVSAASPALLRHTGPALVFDSAAEAATRLDDPGLDVGADTVLVLRNVGPKGAGMPEAASLPLPRKLLAAGVRDMVRISDARMSGTAYGTVVLHVCPEAAAGGPLALVRDGDLVALDVEAGRLDLLVEKAELDGRRESWVPPALPERVAAPLRRAGALRPSRSGSRLPRPGAPRAGRRRHCRVGPASGRVGGSRSCSCGAVRETCDRAVGASNEGSRMVAAAKPDDRVRVGIVGGGRIADLNTIGWLQHERGEIVAVCDLDETRRRARAAEWGCAAYAGLDELLADPNVDAVEILTPHHLHAEQAIAAFEAGKHVSLQKPPTLSLDEYDRVATAAARAGTVFKVYENFLFYPPHVLARAIVDEGGVGDVLTIRIVTANGRLHAGQGWPVPDSAQAWRRTPELCGGGPTTFDHGFHCYQLGRMFVEAPIEVVHAFITLVELGDGLQVDPAAHISWRYAGAPARHGSWDVVDAHDLDVASKYYVSDDRVEIRGTRGVIWVNQCSGRLLEEPSVVHYRDGVTRGFHRVETDWSASFRDCTFDFIDAVLERRPPRLDAAEGRTTLAFALAALRSAAEHREVTIAEMG